MLFGGDVGEGCETGSGVRSVMDLFSESESSNEEPSIAVSRATLVRSL